MFAWHGCELEGREGDQRKPVASRQSISPNTLTSPEPRSSLCRGQFSVLTCRESCKNPHQKQSSSQITYMPLISGITVTTSLHFIRFPDETARTQHLTISLFGWRFSPDPMCCSAEVYFSEIMGLFKQALLSHADYL